MPHGFVAFLVHWAVLTLLLWVASHVFKGISYSSPGALWVAALLLGLVNAIVRPVLVVLTLPLTISLGLFLLVIQRSC
jgi:putative membrane protein